MGGFFGFNNNDEAAKKSSAEKAAAEQKASGQSSQSPQSLQAAITGYAGMSAMQRREKEVGLANGGMVRGKGTGTSDSIPMELRKGSYVLPADSTRKMNEEKVPVRVSNGERVFSPKELQAIGAQVVEAMKVATHTPVNEKSAKLQMLADGGVVDDKRKNVFTDANTDTQTGKPKSSEGFTPQGQGASFVQRAKANAAVPDMAASNAKEFQSAIDTEAKMNAPAPVVQPSKVQPSGFLGNTRNELGNTIKGMPEAFNVGGFPGAVGYAINRVAPTVQALSEDVFAKPLIRDAIPFANTVNTAVTGDATPRIGDSTPQGTKPQSPGQSVVNDTSQGASAANPVLAQATPKPATSSDEIYKPLANLDVVEYKGDHGERAFSNIRPEDRNKGGNMTVVPANTYGMYDPTKPLPVAQPTQQAQGFAPGNQINHVESVGFGFEPKDPAIARADAIQRNAEMAAGRAGISQYTPKMLEAETNKMQSYDNMATTGMNNATRQAEIASNAEARGAELAQRGSQFDATNWLAKNADNRAQETHGFALADTMRMQNALNAVNNAKTPEELRSASDKLQALQGKNPQEVFAGLPGGNTVDAAGNVIKLQNLVYNKVTGKVMNTDEQGQAQPKYDQKTAQGMKDVLMKRNIPADEIRKLIDVINANTQ